MTRAADSAAVLLNEERIGTIYRSDRGARFEPTPEWAERPEGERSVLGQQFEDDPYAAHVSESASGLPSWFEHILPETEGALRGALSSALSMQPDISSSFELLLLLGQDLPGAVRVEPDQGPTLESVARRVREARRGGADDVLPLRVSLAGVQFKISARLGKRGVAVPGWDEEGDWIVKFADQAHEALPAVEYWTMRWAKLAGLNVPDIRLERTDAIEGLDLVADVAGSEAFAIRRYDRSDEGRIHQEDFAQILGLPAGRAKYLATTDSIVNIVRELCPEDVPELLSRLAFCVLCGNDDAHAKNWSLCYPDRLHGRLSPAYDMVATLAFPQYRRNTKLSLPIAGAATFEAVSLQRFGDLSVTAGIDRATAETVVAAAVLRQKDAWNEIREALGFPDHLRTFGDAWLASLPLSRELS